MEEPGRVALPAQGETEGMAQKELGRSKQGLGERHLLCEHKEQMVLGAGEGRTASAKACTQKSPSTFCAPENKSWSRVGTGHG